MTRRFLDEHRQPVGDYDRIRLDEAEVARLRARLDLETALEVHWTWDYVTEVESLRALYEKGKTAQWNVETEIDWSHELSRETLLMPLEDSVLGAILQMMGKDQATVRGAVFEELEWGISQLLHGEQAALQLCAQLVNTCPDLDAKLFAGQQVVDECRHVEMFAKLLSRKFGRVHPIGGNIKFLLDEMLTTPDWKRKLIGMQLLFEGVAMAIITDIGMRTHSPLIKQVMRMVSRDEARHAAFGVLLLRETLGDLPQDERDELEDWTWMCLEVVANGLMAPMIDDLAPGYGLSPDAVSQAIFSSEGFWDARYHLFNHTVLPNLRKLGLITDRTRAGYDRFRLLEKQPPFGMTREHGEELYAS